MPDTANPNVLVKTFALQSFFDNTQLRQALLAQALNSPIVSADSTRQVKGKLLGLHPSSQTPVAVRLKAGGRQGGDNSVVLTPGQVYRARGAGFDGIEWGLPFGWLGGGVAQLHIADNDDAFLSWPQQKVEVLIQRQRALIAADVNPSAAAFGSYNWPTRFPWPNAARYNTVTPATPISQAGQPILAVEPTRILLRLRVNNLANPAGLRLIWRGDNGYDIGSDGITPSTTDQTYLDVTFPAWAGTATGFPVVEIQTPYALLGGDSAVVTFQNIATNVATLAGSYVDILRFGRI